jgi:hypothetical protein
VGLAKGLLEEDELTMQQARAFAYACLRGEPTELDLLADVGSLITLIGQHVKHRYGLEAYITLLDFIDSQKLKQEKSYHLRPEEMIS